MHVNHIAKEHELQYVALKVLKVPYNVSAYSKYFGIF